MNIRPEEKTDFKQVECLIREAFWNVYRPGCYEHYILHNLRFDSSFIRALDYVLEVDNRIIGHISYSKNKLMTDNNKYIDMITLGPVAIHPDYQNRGYGSKIIQYTLEKAKCLGIKYVFVVGDEHYYKRFGFIDAKKYGIQYNDVEGNTPFFMIKVFDEDSLNYENAKYINNPLFDVNEEDLEAFDKNFPPKIKEIRENHLKI